MAGPNWRHRFVALLLAGLLAPAPLVAQEEEVPPAEPTGKFDGLVDEPFKLEVTLRGSRAVFDARFIRPAGNGPFPLAVVMHGGITDYPRRAAYRTERYAMLAQEMARRGWASLLFLRLGYGATGGEPIEFSGVATRCDSTPYEQPITAVADQIAAAINGARRYPFVDGNRIIAIGQSYGGVGVIALSTLPVDGLKAVVNFAGGAGSNEKGDVCNRSELFGTVNRFGSRSRVPSLWIYAQNDKWIPPDVAAALYRSFIAGGGKAEFVDAPPSGSDGHGLSGRRAHVNFWSTRLDEFLRANGLPTWSPQNFNLAAVGLRSNPRNEDSFGKYLAGGSEKAIAASSTGAWWYFVGQTSSEEARRKAMDSCRKASPNNPCRIIATNFELVPR